MDGRLWDVEGGVWRCEIVECVFHGLVGREEGAGGGDRREDDGGDALVEAAVKGTVGCAIGGVELLVSG